MAPASLGIVLDSFYVRSSLTSPLGLVLLRRGDLVTLTGRLGVFEGHGEVESPAAEIIHVRTASRLWAARSGVNDYVRVL